MRVLARVTTRTPLVVSPYIKPNYLTGIPNKYLRELFNISPIKYSIIFTNGLSVDNLTLVS